MSSQAELLREIVKWFPDIADSGAFVCKWMEAVSANALCSSIANVDAAALNNLWSDTCSVLRASPSSIQVVLQVLAMHIETVNTIAANNGGGQASTSAAGVTSAALAPTAAVIAETGVTFAALVPTAAVIAEIGMSKRQCRDRLFQTAESIISDMLRSKQHVLKKTFYATIKHYFQGGTPSSIHNGPSRAWNRFFPSPPGKCMGPIEAVSVGPGRHNTFDPCWMPNSKITFQEVELTAWYDPFPKSRYSRPSSSKSKETGPGMNAPAAAADSGSESAAAVDMLDGDSLQVNSFYAEAPAAAAAAAPSPPPFVHSASEAQKLSAAADVEMQSAGGSEAAKFGSAASEAEAVAAAAADASLPVPGLGGNSDICRLFDEVEVRAMTHTLELMGIAVQISSPLPYPTEPGWLWWPAEFRCVNVWLILSAGRNVDVLENPIFNDVVARSVLSDDSNPKFFNQFLQQLMPFDETTTTGDALQLTLPNGEIVYALLVEASDGFASEIFDRLADQVKADPFATPFRELLQMAHACLSILSEAHCKGVADLCNPRGWTFSNGFKDGHGVTAVAYVQATGGSSSALFLGPMCRAKIVGNCIHSETGAATRRQQPLAPGRVFGSRRATGVQERSLKAHARPAVRASARLVVSRGYVKLCDMLQQMEEHSSREQSKHAAPPSGPLFGRVGTSESALLQTQDLKKLAACLIAALQGGRGDNFLGGDPPDLLRCIWQEATQDNFASKFGLLSAESLVQTPSLTDTFWKNSFSKLPTQERRLLEVVCKMYSEGTSAKSILEHSAFQEDNVCAALRKEHIQGLDSMISDAKVLAIIPLILENPQQKTQHYYVAGSKSQFTGDKVSRGVWLVYDLRVKATGESEWYRSLFLGEAGQAGDIVGRYKNNVWAENLLMHMEKRWLLYLPGRGHAMDGHCRGRGDAAQLVQDGNVACFANSAKGTSTCRREWYPRFQQYTANNTIGRPVEGCMVLLLKIGQDKYTELTYAYEYEKEDSSARIRSSFAGGLAQQWGGGLGGRGRGER